MSSTATVAPPFDDLQPRSLDSAPANAARKPGSAAGGIAFLDRRRGLGAEAFGVEGSEQGPSLAHGPRALGDRRGDIGK